MDKVDARCSRRLAAILFADVVGFSTRMSEDETSTDELLSAQRRNIVDPEVI